MAFPRIARTFQEYVGQRNFTPANANFSSISGRAVNVGGGRNRITAQTGNNLNQFRTKSRLNNLRNFGNLFNIRPNLQSGGRVLAGTLPISATSGASALIQGGGSLLTKGVNFFKQSFSPLAIKNRAVVVPLITGGAVATGYGLSGKLYNPFTPRKLALAGGYVVGGVPALIGGALTSGTVESSRLAKDVFNKTKNFSVDTRNFTPNIPSIPSGIVPTGTFNSPSPTFTPSFNVTAPALSDAMIPSFTGPSASVNPSVNVGGGSGTSELLLLALLGGGLGGYLLGRKKRRKKQKYKKRRRR